jgi:hypothetical protein
MRSFDRILRNLSDDSRPPVRQVRKGQGERGCRKATEVLLPSHSMEVTMTTRADGMRRIATANATIATVSVAGVVGLSVMLAQQGTHHTAATIPSAVTSTSTSSDDTTTSTSSNDTTTTVTATPQATVQQSTSGSHHHAVTSGS